MCLRTKNSSLPFIRNAVIDYHIHTYQQQWRIDFKLISKEFELKKSLRVHRCTIFFHSLRSLTLTLESDISFCHRSLITAWSHLILGRPCFLPWHEFGGTSTEFVVLLRRHQSKAKTNILPIMNILVDNLDFAHNFNNNLLPPIFYISCLIPFYSVCSLNSSTISVLSLSAILKPHTLRQCVRNNSRINRIK